MNCRITLSILFSSLAISFPAWAQETTPPSNPLKFSGELAFDYSLYSNEGAFIPSKYAGAGDNTYNFNSGQALVSYEKEKFSLISRLTLGKYNYSDGTTTTTKANLSVDQIEVHHLLSDKMDLGFGRLSTILGLESYMRYENPFYLYSVSFNSVLPAYGDGLRLTYTHSDAFKIIASSYNEISVASPWDEKSKTRKATELVFQGAADKLSYSLGAVTGKNELGTEITIFDAWVSYNIAENFTLWLNHDAQNKKPSGGSNVTASSNILQLQYKHENHAFALRYENLVNAKDPIINADSIYTGDLNIIGLADRITLSENLSISLELYQHMAENKDYVDKDSKAVKDFTHFIIGALATF